MTTTTDNTRPGWKLNPVAAYRVEAGKTYRMDDRDIVVAETELVDDGTLFIRTTEDLLYVLEPFHQVWEVGTHPLRAEALAYQNPADTAAGRISPAAADRWANINREYRSRLISRMRKIQPTGSLVGCTLWGLQRGR